MDDAATLHLKPSIRRWLLILILSLAFVAIGFVLPDDDSGSWFVKIACIAFFGLCAIVSALQFVPGLNGLTITPQDFTVSALGRRNTTAWSEVVGDFRVVNLSGAPEGSSLNRLARLAGPGRQRLVGFDMTPPRCEGRLASWNKQRFDIHGALSDTYGMTHQQLADLMNARLASWRSRPA